MLDREACERRVYRLAVLLTGSSVAAVKVMKQVLDAQPDLRNIDGAHMDRLTVLRSREFTPMALNDPVVPPEVAEALAKLPAQQREAWVFARVYRMDQREMARAMDCSTTALSMHLDQADEAMARWLGRDAKVAADQLLRYQLALDVPAVQRHWRWRNERLRRVALRAALAVAILGCIVGCVWAVRLWLQQ
jgi:hypothetical protein